MANSAHRSSVIRAIVPIAIAGFIISCGGTAVPSDGQADTDAPAPLTTVSLGALPESARVSNGGPEPRSAAYWITWSSCGEGSQAATAAANGGRAAGWVLVDDLIEDPGLSLGDHVVATCDEAVRALKSTPLGAATDRRPALLVRELLTANLNLAVYSESCEGVEAAVAVGQSLLASIGYGEGTEERDPAAREGELMEDATSALAEYNLGTLCH